MDNIGFENTLISWKHPDSLSWVDGNNNIKTGIDISQGVDHTVYGWMCPKCNRVMAPNMPFCLFCNTDTNTYVKSNNTKGE